MGITLVNGKKHNVIKRDGRIEPYDQEKMRAVLMWATNNSPILTEELLHDINIKIHDQIRIEKLFDAVIETAANKISDLYPIWDKVARNLYLQKIYKETWKIKRDEYPDYLEVVKKGLQYKIYDRIVIDTFTEEELQELGDYIKPERDFQFDYLGLRIFMDKYSLRYTQHKNLELPQHGFMRLAIFAFWRESKDIRLQLIKKRYDDLSLFLYSEATPKWLNSLTPNAQMSSCVLTAMGDDSWSINHTVSNIGIYSKYGGGIACDVSPLRAKGSKIGARGTSSGPVPFIQMIEAAIRAYNQQGVRQGAACVYFNWWHMDVEDMLMLKDEGGTVENRARLLKYAIKLNKRFLRAIVNDEDIYLFDPKETPELIEATGEEFDKWYEHYSNKTGIKKKKIKATDLAYLLAKMRLETGNIYIFFNENVNAQTPFKEYINSSNLCTEIALASRPSYLKNSRLLKEYEEHGRVSNLLTTDIDPGEIALCNLSSINLMKWVTLSETEKREMIYNLLRASDNLIDYAYYPVLEGKMSNVQNRPIGIGFSNLAQLLASRGLKFTDDKALQFMFEITEDVAYVIYEESAKLAKERGPFENFHKSKWKDGWLPIDSFNLPKEKFKRDWETLRQKTKEGVRFICHLSIAPTACTTKESTVVTIDGIKTLQDIMNENEIDYGLLESYGIPVWRNLKKPLEVVTRKGVQKAKRIWYNGMRQVYEVIFADGKSYKFTGNHKLVQVKNNQEKWIEVSELKSGDEVRLLDTCTIEIISIKKAGWKHTYDLEILPDHEYYLGNGVVTHNTSALIIGATESINPVKKLITMKTGTYNCKQLAPNLNKYREYYQTAWEVPNKRLLEMAAIRQVFMDQAQSIDLFYPNPESAAAAINDIIYADNLGVKTLYYANIRKRSNDEGDDDEKCESCSS